MRKFRRSATFVAISSLLLIAGPAQADSPNSIPTTDAPADSAEARDLLVEVAGTQSPGTIAYIVDAGRAPALLVDSTTGNTVAAIDTNASGPLTFADLGR